MQTNPNTQDEPTSDDLAEIEREMPLIEAGIDLVDAEIQMLTAIGGPSPLDWRRLRRAEARVTRIAAEFAGRTKARTVAGQVAA